MATRYAGGANGNRSLERGIEILRAFRPGVDTLENGEISERTGLARSTVSRLTRTLVDLACSTRSSWGGLIVSPLQSPP